MADTNELLRQIKAQRIEEYLENNKDEFLNFNLSEYLENLISEKGLSKAEVIKRTNISRTYAYSFFDGTRKPNRDQALQLCIALALTFDETQDFLKHTGFSVLYPRNPRDSVIIFALENKKQLMEVNYLLDENGMKVFE